MDFEEDPSIIKPRCLKEISIDGRDIYEMQAVDERERERERGNRPKK